MFNYTLKSHRGRAREKKTDSLCILEFNEHIIRAYAAIFANKRAHTVIPIITKQVAANSTILTDEMEHIQI